MWIRSIASNFRSQPRPVGQMIETMYPASRRTVASCHTRRSKGLGRFSTRIRTLRGETRHSGVGITAFASGRVRFRRGAEGHAIIDQVHSSSRLAPRTARSPIGSAEDFAAQEDVALEPSLPCDGWGWLLVIEPPGPPPRYRRRAAGVDARGGAAHLRQPERDRSPLRVELVPPGDRAHTALLAAVEEQLDLVLPRHLQEILDQDSPRCLVEHDPAPML